MPHKHKRKRGNEPSDYDLPPTTHATSLPVIHPTKDFLQPRKKPKLDKRNGKERKASDDTPKVFARLMAWHKQGKKLSTGLDDGNDDGKNKKRRKQPPPSQAQAASNTNTKEDSAMTSDEQPQSKSNIPTILPGESLAEFNIRVDQSMPIASIPKHNNVKIPGVRDEQRLTKHNKRLARMQSEWRNTEAKLREKQEEEDEANEEKREADRMLWMDVGQARLKGKKKKRAQVEEDPWKQLERKRAETKQKSLQDVVQAPPALDTQKLRKMQRLFKTNGPP